LHLNLNQDNVHDISFSFLFREDWERRTDSATKLSKLREEQKLILNKKNRNPNFIPGNTPMTAATEGQKQVMCSYMILLQNSVMARNNKLRSFNI